MILEKGNMWDVYDQSDLFLITANSSLNNKGELIMGAGIAKEAKERFPHLPKEFGKCIVKHEFYGLFPYGKIGLFQTKISWRNPSTIFYIFKSTYKLLEYLEQMTVYNKNYRVDLNFPGIGLGGLSREEVLPIISVLPDNVHIWELE